MLAAAAILVWSLLFCAAGGPQGGHTLTQEDSRNLSNQTTYRQNSRAAAEGHVWIELYLTADKSLCSQTVNCQCECVYNAHCSDRLLLIGLSHRLEPYYHTLPHDATLCCPNNKRVAVENSSVPLKRCFTE